MQSVRERKGHWLLLAFALIVGLVMVGCGQDMSRLISLDRTGGNSQIEGDDPGWPTRVGAPGTEVKPTVTREPIPGTPTSLMVVVLNPANGEHPRDYSDPPSDIEPQPLKPPYVALPITLNYQADYERVKEDRHGTPVDAIRRACAAWEAGGSECFCKKIKPPPWQGWKEPAQDHVNVIGWARFEGEGKHAVAATFLWYEEVNGTTLFSDADIYLNAKYKFRVNAPIRSHSSRRDEWRGEGGEYDLQSAVTHEMGHLLGLADLTEEEEEQEAVLASTMYPFIWRKELRKQTPTAGDLRAVDAVPR